MGEHACGKALDHVVDDDEIVSSAVHFCEVHKKSPKRGINLLYAGHGKKMFTAIAEQIVEWYTKKDKMADIVLSEQREEKMKIFAYALRSFDEEKFFVDACERLGIEYGFTSDYPSMENAYLAEGCEGVAIITNPMYPEILDKYYSLGVRYLATRSIGYDHIDVKYAKSIGMKVTHVSYAPESVADYTVMMLLMAVRKMPYIMDKARLQDFGLKGKMGRNLNELTVGVIGTGRIGKKVVQELSGFGCKILAYDIYENDMVKQYAEYTDLERIYRESDVITLHVPGFEENYHMINRETFAKMKDGVIIVNPARGMLIDTEAMIEALENGKIGFAALDTIENEAGLYYLNHECDMLKNRERAILMSFPNVLVSPHMAFYTERSVKDMVENAINGLINCKNGGFNEFEV